MPLLGPFWNALWLDKFRIMSFRPLESEGRLTSGARVLALLALTTLGSGCAAMVASTRAKCDPILASQGMCPEEQKPTAGEPPVVPAFELQPMPIAAVIPVDGGRDEEGVRKDGEGGGAAAPDATGSSDISDPLEANAIRLAEIRLQGVRVHDEYNRNDVVHYIASTLLHNLYVPILLKELEEKYEGREHFYEFKARVEEALKKNEDSMTSVIRNVQEPGYKFTFSFTGSLSKNAMAMAEATLMFAEHEGKPFRSLFEKADDMFHAD